MCFKIETIQKTQLAKTISCAIERNNNVYWCYMKMCFKIVMKERLPPMFTHFYVYK